MISLILISLILKLFPLVPLPGNLITRHSLQFSCMTPYVEYYEAQYKNKSTKYCVLVS